MPEQVIYTILGAMILLATMGQCTKVCYNNVKCNEMIGLER